MVNCLCVCLCVFMCLCVCVCLRVCLRNQRERHISHFCLPPPSLWPLARAGTETASSGCAPLYLAPLLSFLSLSSISPVLYLSSLSSPLSLSVRPPCPL